MAGSAMVTGLVGGHLSDRIGRRPMMLVGRGFFCLASLGALAAGENTLAGLAVIVATGALSSLGDAADSAMVADLVAPDDRERAYAALRVAANMGVVLGPPIGGLLLARLVEHAVRRRRLPVGHLVGARVAADPARAAGTRRSGARSRSAISVVFRDRPFMALLGGAVLAWMVYVGFELLLPISVVQHHGIDRSLWGVIAIVNPLLVALLQLRVTNAAHAVRARHADGRGADADGPAVPGLRRLRRAADRRRGGDRVRVRRDAVGADDAGGRRRPGAGRRSAARTWARSAPRPAPPSR